MHLLEGPEEKEKVSTRQASNPQPFKFLLPSRVLYCWATTTAQLKDAYKRLSTNRFNSLWRISIHRIRLPILPRFSDVGGIEVNVGEVSDHRLVETDAVALQQLLGQLGAVVVDQALDDAPSSEKMQICGMLS